MKEREMNVNVQDELTAKAAYEPPQIELVITARDMEREVTYAGIQVSP